MKTLIAVVMFGVLCFVPLVQAQDSLHVRCLAQTDQAGYARAVAVQGDYAYVAVDEGGLAIFDVTNPTAPIWMATDTLVSGWGVAVSGDYAYLAHGGENRLAVINVANPSAPDAVALYDLPDAAWGVAVRGSYAYVADGNSGLRIINVTDPAEPTEAGFFDTPGTAYGVAVHMTVNGLYAYVADGYSGLRIINVTNPAAPTEAGFYNSPGSCLGVAISGDGSYACLADWNSLRIVSIINPTAPTEVGFSLPLGEAGSVAVSGNHAYVANGFNGLRIFNIANPALPIEVGFYNTPGLAQGVAVDGCVAYVADGLYFGLYKISYFQPGCGVPSAPDDLVMQTIPRLPFPNLMRLVWTPVHVDTNGLPIDVSRYVIYYRSDTTDWHYIGRPSPLDTNVFTDSSATGARGFYQVRAVVE